MSVNNLVAQNGLSKFLNPGFANVNLRSNAFTGQLNNNIAIANCNFSLPAKGAGTYVLSTSTDLPAIGDFTFSNNGIMSTSTANETINITPNGTGQVNVNSELNVNSIKGITAVNSILLGDLQLTSDSISSTETNSNLNLNANGTGIINMNASVNIPNADSYQINSANVLSQNALILNNASELTTLSSSASVARAIVLPDAAGTIALTAQLPNQAVNTSSSPTFVSETLTGNLNLPVSSVSAGRIYMNSLPFITDPGNNNIFMGENAGNTTMTGIQNIGIGSIALTAETNGNNNVAIGASAMTVATGANSNVAVGSNSLTMLQNGSNNVAVGRLALTACQNTNGNTAIGYSAGPSITSGSDNIFIGYNSGSSLLGAEANNTIIGASGTLGDADTIRIGVTAATATKCFIDGIQSFNASAGTAMYILSTGQLGVLVSSKKFKENIEDLTLNDNFDKLRPVKYNYINDEKKVMNYGLIAEEVKEVFPELIQYDDKDEILTVKYQFLYAMMIEEIQKLKKDNIEMKKDIVALKQLLIKK